MIAIHADPHDQVATVLAATPKGADILGYLAAEPIPAGHKMAVAPIRAGEPVRKYGHVIGNALRPIAPGDHVHVHNLGYQGKSAIREVDARPIDPIVVRPAAFEGYVRCHGRVGTRNFIGVLTTVNCSASVARAIERHFTDERLAAWPGVDGVASFTHQTGCGLAHSGVGIENLKRTLSGYMRHPNFAGVLLIGLGCEVNQIDPLFRESGLGHSATLHTLSIQERGGTKAAIEAGIAVVNEMLPAAAAARRETVSAAHLTVGLQCGGSDGYSAITANPVLGRATDRLVAAGGRALLSETPEIFGAEDLLVSRASDAAVAKALRQRLDWWEDYATRNGADLNNNPSPGNLAGGITTILEKSLGAVAKAGSTALNAVIDYAAPVRAPGLTFMDSPGYDPASATGQIASGANIILFTTGRGSVFGSRPAPTIKLASNTLLAERMFEDIDLDCGRLLSGDTTLNQLADELFELILRVASGQPTASERAGLGGEEFVPWTPGAVF